MPVQKYTKRVLVIIAALALMTLAACGSGSAGGTTKVKLGHTLTENSAWQKGAEYFADKIEKQTDGDYEVDIFPNGQIASGDQGKAIEMLRRGDYDIDISSLLIWSGFDSTQDIVAMPWILPTFEDVEAVEDGNAGELLMSSVEDSQHVKANSMGETGYRHMYSNKRQITQPDDLENLKIRIPVTPLYKDLYKNLGANPSTLDFTEVYSGLQQGTIDGVEGVTDVLLSSKINEVVDYASINNYNFDFFYLTYSEDFWNGLSKSDKKIFEKVGKDASAYITDYTRKANKSALDKFKEDVDTVELTDEQIQEFIDASKPVYDKYRDQFPAELRDAFDYPE